MEGGSEPSIFEGSAIGLICHPNQQLVIDLLGRRMSALCEKLLATDKRQVSDSKNPKTG